MIDWIQISFNLFNQSSDRIIWNLFLAFIPLALSYYLFRSSVTHNIIWWLLLVTFGAFLPNAPYILTDSIHIIEISQQDYPFWSIIVILIPQYVIFIMTGFGAYGMSLINLDKYLTNFIDQKSLILVNAIAHLLCVVGIYIGRFERFNSWDLLTKPGEVLLTTVQDLLDPWKVFSMAIAFVVIWLLAELIKLVNDSFISFYLGKN